MLQVVAQKIKWWVISGSFHLTKLIRKCIDVKSEQWNGDDCVCDARTARTTNTALTNKSALYEDIDQCTPTHAVLGVPFRNNILIVCLYCNLVSL